MTAPRPPRQTLRGTIGSISVLIAFIFAVLTIEWIIR
jgi:hypothetical protein